MSCPMLFVGFCTIRCLTGYPQPDMKWLAVSDRCSGSLNKEYWSILWATRIQTQLNLRESANHVTYTCMRWHSWSSHTTETYIQEYIHTFSAVSENLNIQQITGKVEKLLIFNNNLVICFCFFSSAWRKPWPHTALFTGRPLRWAEGCVHQHQQSLLITDIYSKISGLSRRHGSRPAPCWREERPSLALCLR